MSRFWFTGAQRRGTDDDGFLATVLFARPQRSTAGRRRSRKRERRAAALPHTRVRHAGGAMHARVSLRRTLRPSLLTKPTAQASRPTPRTPSPRTTRATSLSRGPGKTRSSMPTATRSLILQQASRKPLATSGHATSPKTSSRSPCLPVPPSFRSPTTTRRLTRFP